MSFMIDIGYINDPDSISYHHYRGKNLVLDIVLNKFIDKQLK